MTLHDAILFDLELLPMSTWLGLKAHRPLGSIMRAGKATYAMGAPFRQENNKQLI
jgi:hypothetical protein